MTPPDLNRESGPDICRLCGAGHQQVIYNDLTTRYHDRFLLKQCANCGYVYTFPMPSDRLLERYYDQNYWQSGKLKNSPALNTFYKLRMSGIVSYIRQNLTPGDKILDWGCGDGAFVKLLRTLGHDCYGLDAYAAKPEVPYIVNATIEKPGFPAEFFNMITCFHVLEHLKNPHQSLAEAFRLLKANGVMIVEVPNFGSLGSRLFKTNWQPLQIPTHISHFTPKTLVGLARRVGQEQIIKTEFFSHRISPSALVLSMFPALAPKRIRNRCAGRYPIALGLLYFVLQLLAYPFAIFGSLVQRGEIVRLFIRKTS